MNFESLSFVLKLCKEIWLWRDFSGINEIKIKLKLRWTKSVDWKYWWYCWNCWRRLVGCAIMYDGTWGWFLEVIARRYGLFGKDVYWWSPVLYLSTIQSVVIACKLWIPPPPFHPPLPRPFLSSVRPLPLETKWTEIWTNYHIRKKLYSWIFPNKDLFGGIWAHFLQIKFFKFIFMQIQLYESLTNFSINKMNFFIVLWLNDVVLNR